MSFALHTIFQPRRTIHAELFPLLLNDTGIWLITRAGDPASWQIDVTTSPGHPMEHARQALVAEWGEAGHPHLLHSTSWRATSSGIVLTFVAVMSMAVDFCIDWAQYVPELVQPGEIAHGGATTAPPQIEQRHVLSHAVRHLAFLGEHDPATRVALGPMAHLLTNWVPALAECLHTGQ